MLNFCIMQMIHQFYNKLSLPSPTLKTPFISAHKPNFKNLVSNFFNINMKSLKCSNNIIPIIFLCNIIQKRTFILLILFKGLFFFFFWITNPMNGFLLSILNSTNPENFIDFQAIKRQILRIILDYKLTFEFENQILLWMMKIKNVRLSFLILLH